VAIASGVAVADLPGGEHRGGLRQVVQDAGGADDAAGLRVGHPALDPQPGDDAGVGAVVPAAAGVEDRTARLTIESTSRFASSANRRNAAISGSGSWSKSASTYSSSSANDPATTRTPAPRPMHREPRCD
jgi:hypothetical protein